VNDTWLRAGGEGGAEETKVGEEGGGVGFVGGVGARGTPVGGPVEGGLDVD
jgi:hypothetical protein